MKLKDFFNNISIRYFCDSKFLAHHAGIIKSKQFTLEIGRSMVEMLGVLAVIGVLSVTGIIGYKYAMTKYIANETINELNLRAHDISLNMDKMIEQNYIGDIQMNMGPITRMGYPITARVSPQYIDYFEIFIKNVPSDVCRELLRTSWTVPYSIFVGIQEFEASVAVCNQADEVDLAYEFYKDLTPKDKIDEDNQHETQRCNHDNNCMCGMCNTDHGLCESFCLIDTSCKKDYDDPRWMMCCEEEYIKGEYCCASVTEDGQCCNREGQCCPTDKPLQDKYGNCHSCDEVDSIEMADLNTCSTICPKRFLNNSYHKRCILCGVEGTDVADKPIWDAGGNCYACDDTRCIEGGGEAPSQEATAANCSRACPNRIKNGSGCCLICQNDTPLRGSDGECHDCNYTGTADLATCGEACLNWTVKDGQCVRTSCAIGTFANLDNVCFKCNITTNIPSTEEECNRCFNRIFENGSCKAINE